MFEAFITEILALREACSVHTGLSRAEGCAQAPLIMGAGVQEPPLLVMFRFTTQGKESLFKNKCGTLSGES